MVTLPINKHCNGAVTQVVDTPAEERQPWEIQFRNGRGKIKL